MTSTNLKNFKAIQNFPSPLNLHQNPTNLLSPSHFPSTQRAFSWEIVLNPRQSEPAHKAQIDVAFRTVLVASSNRLAACVTGA